MNILVTGGAGYIGTMMTKQLRDAGHDVVIFDDLSSGHDDTIDASVTCFNGDITRADEVKRVFDEHAIEAVMHFAGAISAGESMKDPAKYFRINTTGTLHILTEMIAHGVTQFVFSSTAAVYGNPQQVPIPEDHPKNPTNTYGQSKLMVEHMLPWFETAHGIRYAALRYFNAAGASIDGTIGERHKDESHIIPRAMMAAVNGTPFTLYGTDYDTKDGTCVRDYIHIEDLCRAHLVSLEKITQEDTSVIYNIGTGSGYTNREVVDMIAAVTGRQIAVEEKERRLGDPSVLIADSSKLQQEAGWKPEHSDLHEIVETAWKFHEQKGFGA